MPVSVSNSGYRSSVFYDVWSPGPSGHSDVHLRQGDPRGKTDKTVQSRQHATGLTYVDDVVEAISRLISQPPQGNSAWSAPTRSCLQCCTLEDLSGNGAVQKVMHVVAVLEKEFSRTAVKEMLPMQPGDVPATYADIDDLARDVGFKPSTTIEQSRASISKWFREYHEI